ACFARSSPRWHRWLLGHPRLGPLVGDYLDGKGVPLRAKAAAILMMWLSLSLSLYVVAPPRFVRIAVACVAAGVTVYLLRLPTRRPGGSSLTR
ncbi:MAG TPA: YbaN family protein, partial [Verrucomicrobiae bacterium]|nr:YbaN family protein [Verrucomicrobiae bacterium]